MPEKQVTELGFKVTGVETLDALADSAGDVTQALKGLSKAKVTIGSGDLVKEAKTIRKVLAGSVAAYEEASRQSEALGFGVVPGKKGLKKLRSLGQAMMKEQEKAAKLQQKLAAAGESGDKGAQKALQGQLKKHQITVRGMAKEAAIRGKLMDADSSRHFKAVDEINDFRDKRYSEHLSDVVEMSEKAFKSIANADPFGLADSAGDFFDKMRKGASSMSAKGGAKGGMMGGMQKGAFKALAVGAKALSKAAKTMSAAQGVWGVIKDALDQTADMNAMILDTSGSLALMGTSWKEFNTGAASARKMLSNITEEVTSVSNNWKYGTTPTEQLELLSAFERQNVTLSEMVGTIDDGGRKMKKFTDFTGYAITLQKALGLESEQTVEAISYFTRDMGMSLKEVSRTFHVIAQNAIEANMNTRDFFATVMQVSSNMALYGNRVGEVAVLLGKLGKALGPRAAKEALSGIANMWKEMGDDQRIVMSKLAGTGTTLKRARADARVQFTGMKDDLAKSLAELGYGDVKLQKASDVAKLKDAHIAALNNGTKEQKELGRRVESLRAQQREINKGGTMGAANAMAFAGPGAGMQLMFDISMKRFSGTPLNKLTGVNAYAYRKMTGISMDQFRQLQALQTQLKGEGDILLNAVKKGADSTDQKEQLERMATSMGISADKLREKIEKGDIKSFSSQQVLNSMTKEQQDKATKNGNLMKSVADQHLGATRKISKILETIIAKVLHKIAGFINSIWTTIASFFDDFDKKDELAALDILGGTLDKRMEKLRTSLLDEGDEKKRASIQKEIQAVEKARQTVSETKGGIIGGQISSKEDVKKAMLEVGKAQSSVTGGKGNVLAGLIERFGEKKGRKMQKQLMGQSLSDQLMPGMVSKKISRDITPDEDASIFERTKRGIAAGAGISPETELESNPLYEQSKAALGRFLGAGAGAGENRTEGGDYALNLIENFQQDLFKMVSATQGEEAAGTSVKTFTEGMTDALRDQTPEQRVAILSALEDAGVFADMLAAGGDTNKMLKSLDKGMTIDRKSKDALATAIAKKFVEAKQRADLELMAREKGVWEGGKISKDKFMFLSPEDKEKLRALAEVANAYAPKSSTTSTTPPKVTDAYFPFGGSAVLTPGDYVINKSAFGKPMMGGKGQMLGQAMASGGAKGGGPGSNITIINNINGGDTERIRDLILRQLAHLRRKQRSTLPV